MLEQPTSEQQSAQNQSTQEQQQVVGHELYISFARNPSEIAEAQRLRYKVFAEEMGANIQSDDGLDQDGFDAFCDHLLIRESVNHRVVGTYRILNPAMANEAGGYYSAGEFDISTHGRSWSRLCSS
jgi:putative hemolysin